MADRISLSGVPETMLQTLYARAEEGMCRDQGEVLQVL